MEITYKIVYVKEVVYHDILKLDANARELIKRAIEARLVIDPIRFGKPLQYSLKGYRRLCVSNYRVVYRVDISLKTVIVVAIKHRKDIYEHM